MIIQDVFIPEYNEEYLNEPDIYIDDNFKVVVNITIIKKFPSAASVINYFY